MPGQILRVGFVGLGHLHPRLYMPLFGQVSTTEVVAAAEVDAALREPFCREFGISGYASLERMLAAESLDVAAIFLPHADCPAAAELCARSGLHLLVEKPMAADVAGARRIVEAAASGHVKLTTGYCWRTHPVAREFRRLLQRGIAGVPVGAEGRCAAGRLQRYLDGNASWMLQRDRAGGGPMLNLGVHWIDLFRWLLAEEVVEVCGQHVKVNKDYDIEDNSFAHLRFASGAIVALDISYTVPDAFPTGRDLYLAVRGTAGTISWAPAYEGARDLLSVCSDHPDFAGSPWREFAFQLEPVPGYSGIMGLEYLRDFAAAVLTDATPQITGHDGLVALQVVEAIDRSAAEKRWVAVER